MYQGLTAIGLVASVSTPGSSVGRCSLWQAGGSATGSVAVGSSVPAAHALSATVSADAVSSKAAREIDMAASSQTWSGPRAVGSLVGRTKGLGGRVTAGNSPARAGDSSHAQL